MFAGCELLTFSHQTQVPEFLEEHPYLSPPLSSLTCKTHQIHNSGFKNKLWLAILME